MTSNITAVQKKNYLKRVRKIWRRRDVVEINQQHPKYAFTQYVRQGMQLALCSKSQHKKRTPHDECDDMLVEFVADVDQAPIIFSSFASSSFKQLRHKIGLIETEYLDVIAPPTSSDENYLEFLSNSKSGQSFFLTPNKQYMIKTITHSEVSFFLHILNRYMKHFDDYPHSIICKIIGLHYVKVKKFSKPIYFVVMFNVFYPDDRILERYDIKGCFVGRYTKPSPQGSQAVLILKEKNLSEKKLKLGALRSWFLKQIEIDTAFLESIGVLDYSLLAGVQPLHEDEKKRNHSLDSIVTRASKSVGHSHAVFNPHDHTTDDDDDYEGDLPGMVADTIISRISSSTSSASCSSTSGCYSKHIPSLSPQRSFMHPSKVVSESEMIAQNRRLLPEETSNPLHIVDYEDRYFIGIIDFFTRYTFKKKLENAYKSVIYKKLSFSTVHPKIFRRRFIKYWEDHTE